MTDTSTPNATTTPLDASDPESVRAFVRERYGAISDRSASCCGPGCCAPDSTAKEQSVRVGYRPEQLASVPEEANLGLGCGSPIDLADLRPGETVLDLGSGGGLDAFLAAQAVGPTGRVVGVDMTPSMLARARENAVRAGLAGTVEFREGILERLPVVDASVDVILSNCVINLSPDKPAVFREAFRVLKPGGRVAVSDILLDAPLPEDLRAVAELYAGCIAGADLVEDYLSAMRRAGFVDITTERTPAREMFEPFLNQPDNAATIDALGRERVLRAAGSIWSYRLRARKP